MLKYEGGLFDSEDSNAKNKKYEYAGVKDYARELIRRKFKLGWMTEDQVKYLSVEIKLFIRSRKFNLCVIIRYIRYFAS